MLKRETLQFLGELKIHNSHEWMEEHKADFEAAYDDFKQLIDALILHIDDFDHHLEGLTSDDSVFSIDRNGDHPDGPYKTHFGAYIAFGGKTSEYAGYYLHVKPGDTFLGGGMYKPGPAVIRKIRQEIDYAPVQILKLANSPKFKEYFKEFKGERLSNVPPGYSRDHEQMEYLKLTSFFVTHHFSAEILCTDDAIDYCLERFNEVYHLNRFLNETFVSQ